MPSLIIAAGDDNMAPDTQALIMPYIYNKRIKLVVIEDASHFLRDLFLEEAMDATLAFLNGQ